jgi:hypothetical protein
MTDLPEALKLARDTLELTKTPMIIQPPSITLAKALLEMNERLEKAEAVCVEVVGISQWGDIIAREVTGQTNWNVLMTKLEAWKLAKETP